MAVVAAPAAEAAAQEAAALGPQLCVILALADSPGHAYLWQNFIYLVSAISYVAAVAASGRSPPKVGDAALPPETGEFLACLVLDIAASISLVVCFPHLNTWHLWALGALLAALFAAVWFEPWRDLVVDLLDPLLVIRSDPDKALPGQQRQRLRRGAWVLTLLCAAVALWDILLHPVEEGLFEPHADDVVGGIPDLWDTNQMLLMRWKPSPLPMPTEGELLGAAAEGLGIEQEKLQTQALLEKHRLWLFKVIKGNKTEDANKLPAHIHWKALALSPKGKMAQLADTEFPSALNVTLCLHAHAAVEMSKHVVELDKKKAKEAKEAEAKEAKEAGGEAAETTEDKPATEDEAKPKWHPDWIKTVGEAADAQAAYMAGCDWWTDMLDATYGGSREEVKTDKTEVKIADAASAASSDEDEIAVE